MSSPELENISADKGKCHLRLPFTRFLTIQDCQKCRKRRIHCDRTLPGCRKCLSRSFQCPGYGRVLRWGQGIASRGRQAGKKVPPANIVVEDTSIVEIKREPISTPRKTKNRQLSLASPTLTLELSPHVNQITAELLYHFQHDMSKKLVWVDIPTNPWRQVIMPLAWASRTVLHAVLALSSEDLASKFEQDNPRRLKLQQTSMVLRNNALVSLAEQIGRMRQDDPSLKLGPNETQFALASTLLLYNLELLGAQSAKWRIHLQAAQLILQWKEQAFPNTTLCDATDSFLSYEQYYANVFAGLTTFDRDWAPDKIVHYPDSTAMFSEFVNIINRVTRAERLQHNHQFEMDASHFDTMIQELDEAKHTMVHLSQILQFQTDTGRTSFLHLVCIFHHASLIYIYHVLKSDQSLRARLQFLRDSILEHVECLPDKQAFACDLVWPLFIAGTECRGDLEKQAIVVREFETVMALSGTLDRRKVLSFLQHFWSAQQDKSITWIQLLREQDPESRMLIL